MDEPWRLPVEVMCRVQREKTWYAGQRGCILSPCQGQNGNPGLLLSMSGVQTGQLTVHVANADGSPVSLTGDEVRFRGSNNVASVDSNGLVTALRPPQIFGETPYISVAEPLQGRIASNASVVRVLDDPLPGEFVRLGVSDIVYYILDEFDSYDYRALFGQYDVPRVTDLAYQLEAQLTGIRPFDGGTQYLVNDPAPEGIAPCGLSGNPVRLGTTIDKDIYNSCLIVAFPPAVPQWGVIFHEMEHNFTFGARRFAQFVRGSDSEGSNIAYSEGLATAAGMFAGEMLLRRQAEYQISEKVAASILDDWLIWHHVSPHELEEYVRNGPTYSTLTADVVDDIILVLVSEFGYQALYRFFPCFCQRTLSSTVSELIQMRSKPRFLLPL